MNFVLFGTRSSLPVRQQGILYGLTAVFLWTGFILISKAGTLTSLAMQDMMAIRFGTAFVVLSPLIWKLRYKLFDIRTFAMGALGGLGYCLSVYAGFERAPATHAALLLPGLMPILIALLAFLFTSESHSRRVWLGIALSSFGILLLMVETFISSPGFWLGDSLFMLACLFWACYTVMVRRWQIQPWQATASVVSVTALVYLPIYFLYLPISLLDISFSMLAIQSLYQGVLATIVQMICYVRAMQILGATGMGSLMGLVPVLAGSAALPLFHEDLTVGLLGSLILVLTGTFISNRKVS